MLTAKTGPLTSLNSKQHFGSSNAFSLSFLNKTPIAKFKRYTKITSFKSSSHTYTTKDLVSSNTRVKILSEAGSFIQKFRGKTIVIKYGGAAMSSEDLKPSVISDIVLLSSIGLRIVVVHGGGPAINYCLKKLDKEPIFVDGIRYTDADTMKIVSMVLLGDVNPNLVALIRKDGGSTIGFVATAICTARPLPHLGYVADIAEVDTKMLRLHVDIDIIPVIAPVAADEAGHSYNINADTVAGEIAAAMGAEKLILLTDVAGILEDREKPESLVKEIDIRGVKKLIDEGKINGGMIPKVNCCLRSLSQGVRTASIIDGRSKHSLLLEILTDEGAGTMITG